MHFSKASEDIVNRQFAYYAHDAASPSRIRSILKGAIRSSCKNAMLLSERSQHRDLECVCHRGLRHGVTGGNGPK